LWGQRAAARAVGSLGGRRLVIARLVSTQERDHAMRQDFLVVYDYGTGGAWAVLRADSPEQVRERFPELRIVTQRPAWLTSEQERLLRERMTIDVGAMIRTCGWRSAW
jgi:hypothetical protein